MSRRRLQRGLATIGVVMMAIGIAMLAAFMLTANGVFQLSVTQTTFNNARARNLAESAVALGVQALQEAVTANKPAQLVSPSPATFILPAPAGCFGGLSFDPLNPQGIPCSVSNLTGTSAITGTNNQVVPPGCVQLIGIGRSGASEIHVCAILYTPAYPFVVACSGQFLADHVVIARATSLPSSAPTSAPSVNPSCYVPGDAVGNSSALTALTLKSTTVTGNAEAVGGVCMDSASKVLQAVEVGIPPAVLPTVNPSTDPIACFAGVQPFPAASATVTLTGMVSASATTTVPGDLDLNGAILYVNGDLNVTGALLGTGAVYTTGALSVCGGAALTSSDVMALVSGGNITLNKGGGSQANFIGMIYTNGDLEANCFHLYGTFVANGGTGSGGNVTLNNTTMVGLGSLSGMTLATEEIFGCCSSCGSKCWCICTTSHKCCITGKSNVGYVGGHLTSISSYSNPTSYRVRTLPCGNTVLYCWTPKSGSVKCICIHSRTFCHCTGCRGCARVQALKYIIKHSNPPCCLAFAKKLLAAFSCGGGPPLVGTEHLCLVSCSEAGQPGVVYHFNFNQFVAPADQARVLLWTEY